jgi:deoxycytidylate deaminase
MEDIIKYVMAEAAKSNLDKRKVGCVIVTKNSNRIIGKGHNCKPERDLISDSTEKVFHAEVNAVHSISAADHYSIVEGDITAIAYVSHDPCKDCASFLLEYGISEVVVVKEFMKFDSDKLRYDLIPPEVLKALAEVLTYGAKKYKPNNWRECDDPERYIGALLRHLQAYRLGDRVDVESGLDHLAMAMTNVAMLYGIDYQTFNKHK